MMVVVTDARLEQRRATGRFDPTGQAHTDERGERVIDSLAGHRAESSSHQFGDLLDPKMAALLTQHRQHGDPLGGAAQPCRPDVTPWIILVLHIE